LVNLSDENTNSQNIPLVTPQNHQKKKIVFEYKNPNSTTDFNDELFTTGQSKSNRKSKRKCETLKNLPNIPKTSNGMRDISKEIEGLYTSRKCVDCSKEVDMDASDNINVTNPFSMHNRSEISTQTETPTPNKNGGWSLFGFFSSFKCG